MTDQNGALLHQRQLVRSLFFRQRMLDFENNIGVFQRRGLIGSDGRTGFLEIRVLEGACLPGARLNNDFGAQGDKFLHGIRGGGNPLLVLPALPWDGDFHNRSFIVVNSGS